MMQKAVPENEGGVINNPPESASRKFIEGIFSKQFPSIIQVVLTYANTNHTEFDRIVQDINQKLLEFVLKTMQNKKGHFESIFKELKI